MARVGAGLAAALAIGMSAWAQDADLGAQADISGGWSFEVEPYFSGDCAMTGDLTLRPREDGGFDCEIFAEERCVTGRVLRARQTCAAERDGERLQIDSQLESVEPANSIYYPDDFTLTIIDGGLMRGELRSSAQSAATFFRGPAPIT